MIPRRLLAVPAVAGLLASAVLASVSSAGPDTYAATLWTLQLAALGLAGFGSVAAAAAFDRGDYMFRAWLFSAISYLLPVLNRLGSGPHGDGFLATVPWRWSFDVTLAIAVNVFSVAALVLFVRAFWAAGLVADGSRLARLMAGAVLAGLAVGVPVIVLQVREALGTAGGEPLLEAIGTAGDVMGFALVTPLLLVALEFRGGALQWPFALLAAANVGWLAYDVVLVAARVAGPGGGAMGPGLRIAAEGIVTAAYAFTCCAGLAHRAAVRGVPAVAAAPRG